MKPYDQITVELHIPGMRSQKHRDHVSEKNPEIKWSELLALAKSRPGMYIGTSSEAHIEAIKGTIDYLVITRPFKSPYTVHIVCSPTQYAVRCKAGPLLKAIERAVDWDTDRMLVDLLRDRYFNRTQGTSIGIGLHPVPLAKRFFVGINSVSGFRHQTYREGWPTTDVLLLEGKNPCSFVIAGQLTPEWFTGLPFLSKDLEAIIAEYPSFRITYEMRTFDDILPEKDEDMSQLCA